MKILDKATRVETTVEPDPMEEVNQKLAKAGQSLDGHALTLRTCGEEGQEGHCLWVWLDKLKLVRDTKLAPDFTPTGGLG